MCALGKSFTFQGDSNREGTAQRLSAALLHPPTLTDTHTLHLHSHIHVTCPLLIFRGSDQLLVPLHCVDGCECAMQHALWQRNPRETGHCRLRVLLKQWSSGTDTGTAVSVRLCHRLCLAKCKSVLSFFFLSSFLPSSFSSPHPSCYCCFALHLLFAAPLL